MSAMRLLQRECDDHGISAYALRSAGSDSIER